MIIKYLFLCIITAIIHCEDHSIKILNPEELITKRKTNIIAGKLTNFGYVPYGQNIRGRVVFPDQDDGCKPLNMRESDLGEQIIIMVKRGNCSFATKVYYGELAGAAMVLILDYEGVVENDKVLVADDANSIFIKLTLYSTFLEVGSDINIPSLLVTYKDGADIIEFIKKPSVSLLVEFSFVCLLYCFILKSLKPQEKIVRM